MDYKVDESVITCSVCGKNFDEADVNITDYDLDLCTKCEKEFEDHEKMLKEVMKNRPLESNAGFQSVMLSKAIVLPFSILSGIGLFILYFNNNIPWYLFVIGLLLLNFIMFISDSTYKEENRKISYENWVRDYILPYLEKKPREKTTELYNIEVIKGLEGTYYGDVHCLIDGELSDIYEAKLDISAVVSEPYLTFVMNNYDFDIKIKGYQKFKKGKVFFPVLHLPIDHQKWLGNQKEQGELSIESVITSSKLQQ